MSSVQDALKAREERKKKEQEESIARIQAKQDKINSAVEAYKSRKKESAQSAVSDLTKRINAEIEAIKTVSTPSWGEDSHKSSLDSTRQSRINISNLTKEVESYKNYLDENTYKTLADTLSQLNDGYTSRLGIAEVRSMFESEDAYNSWYEDYKTKQEWANSEQGAKGWEKYLADEEKETSKKKRPTWQEAIIRGFTTSSDNPFNMAVNNVTYDYRNDDSYMKPNDKWSEVQQKIFGYLYMESPAKAYEYAKETNNNINKGIEAERIKKIQDFATSNFGAGAASTLGAIAAAPFGLADALNDILEYSARGTITNDGFVSPFEYSQAVTGGISEHLNEKSGVLDEDIPIIGGKGLGDVYGLGTSIAQSMASAYTLGPTGTLVSYFGQGAAAGADEALSRGASEGQAILYGLALGTFEGLAEMVGVDRLFSLGSSATIKGLLKNVLSQAGAEGMEEGLTALLSNIADNVIMQDKSNFNALVQQYMAQGMSESDAKKKAWMASVEGIAFDTIAGAVSGGVSGGVHTGVSNIASNIDAKQMYGDGADLVTEALEIDADNAFAQKMKAKVDAGKNLSGGQINRLVEANEQTLKTQDTAKMKAAVEARLTELGETGDISKLSDVIVKAQSGGKLTASERTVLTESKYGRRVSTELNPKSIESGEYTSGWAEKIGTERINTEAYNRGLKALADDVAGVSAAKYTAPVQMGFARQENGVPVDKNATVEEIATEGKFKASQTGKAKIGDTEVSIKEIASVKGGEMILRLEDGSTVNASDVEYGSSAEALIYESVTDMNLNAATANAFVKGFEQSEGLSAQEYVLGFREAYRYGEYGFPVQEMSKDGFSAKLSQTQRSLAYDLGKTDMKYKVAENQSLKEKIASTSAKNAEKIASTGAKKGKVHYAEGILVKNITQRQKASLKGLERLAEALGVEFHIFESAVGENGKRKGANGWFDPKDGSIHLDLHAGAEGEGTILFTAAHELTHFIREWSPEKFKVFADFLLEQYGQKGISVDALVRKQIEKAKKNGRDIDFDTAYEEVIADSCESMLADGEIVQKLAELKAKDKTLWEKIKSFIADLVAKIKAAYEGLSPDSIEGRYVAEMLDAAERLKELWTEALVDASEASALVEIDAETESVSPLFSERTWTESEYVTEREKAAKAISNALNVDINTAYKYIDDINGVARLIADDRVRLDYEPNLDDKASVLKPNSEYKYSVDMSTLCAKRLLFTGTFDAIQKALPNTVFDSEDIVSLREMMQKRGYEVACGICYVESTRREIGRITQEFIDRYKVAQQTGEPISRINSSGKEVVLKSEGRTFSADKDYTPNLGELNTTDIDIVKRDHREVYDAYLAFMNARGQAKPKLLETRAEYKGEILKHFKAKSAVEARNNAGGLRLQSFSDFEVPHLIDMMQVVMDMSRVGLKSQAYTKVPAFAEVFGDSGVKINLSLIAKGDGLDANGNLIFDDVEGINHKEAFRLRDQYSKNVGTILVGKTDAHIIAAMADPRIDYIIPFHKSSWKESLYDALGLTGYADYTDFQNEKPIDKDRKIKNFDPSEYWDFTKSGDENAQIYLEKCREDGRIPKFTQFQGYPGYWKLLIDFKMYDNDGVGSPQEVVSPIFNTEASERILREYEGGHKSFPVAKDVVEDFVKDHKDIRYSDRYQSADTNSDILSMVEKVESGDFKANDKVDLGTVSDSTAAEIYNITGINVEGFKVAIEARQINHIIKDHGKNGLADRSMADPSDIAKIEFALEDYDDIRAAGKTQAYTHMVNGRNKTADTVLYEKSIGEKAYYVVQAVPNTKAKTLYIVTAFIGKKGYKKEASQLIDAKSPDATAKTGSADTSVHSISQTDESVNSKFSDRDPDSVSNRSLLANALESVAQNDIERNKLKEYKGKIALIESEQAKLAEVKAQIKELSFAKGKRDTEAIKKLQFEANQSANRINTYDRQLLNLEATAALKGVLQREKQLAYKKAEREGKDALARYKEKAAKTQRELLTRYQESRKKGVEGRRKTEMRYKIKGVVNELNQYLKNTKEKHVPIQLQKPVAEALAAVNMDTVGAEKRLAEIHAKLQKDPLNHQLLESYRRIAEQGERMNEKLQALKNAYDDIVNSDDPLIANSHDDVISNSIDRVIDVVGNTPLRDMSLSQLEEVYDMYRMVLTSIRGANKAFKVAKGEEISQIANGVISELVDMKRKSPAQSKAMKALSEFDWNNLKPVYAFERIESANFRKVFNAVRAGEDTWAVDVTEAKGFSGEQRKKYHYDSWDFKKKYGFETKTGEKFELDLGEIMSLYAYAKDEHSKGHLTGDGFVFDPKKEVVEKTKSGIKITYNVEDAKSYNIAEETLASIIGELTQDQRDFVDAMQDYLSTTMGEKGNEVSLELYGIKLFKKKDYFPLKVSHAYMAVAKEKAQGDVKIKNKGFTKERKEGAKNPIVLTSFMDVWADHVNEMSMYHAFTLPLEDFYRVFNYKAPAAGDFAPVSVNSELINAHGNASVNYIEQLLKDLNGGARVDPTAGIINKMTGLFKKSAVFASASVVIQQPSAIARATALVDPKYFVGKPAEGKHKETWAEVKKYAPVAVIKEMGYFDTGMGQSTVEWIKDDKTWRDKVDDFASKAPALADEYAWCVIWNAVKRETLQTYKDLRPSSEEFLKAVGERFTEVITKTQVYDSVLARSANMRSKDTGMKMATAFMGEPTTSLNMIEDALTKGKRGNKRYARKAIGAVAASMILNSILVSIVYAGRDDDEDKTYTEKYIATLTEELLDSINPLTLIPFVKDIVSIVQGYDVERSDMAVVTDIIKAWRNLGSDNRTVYRKVEDFAGAIAALFGLPVKNVMRDVRAVYNTVNSFINGEKTTGEGIKNALGEAVTGKAKSDGQQLYEAMASGDAEQTERVKGRFKDDKAITSAIRTALRENDSRIHDAAVARYSGNISEYTRIAREIIAEGNFKQDDVVAAINSEINALKKADGKEDATSSDSNKATSIYKMEDYYAALIGRDQAAAHVVKEDILKVAVANGKDRDEAEADFNSSFASHLREEYEAGNLTDNEAVNMLVEYGGKTEEGADAKVQYWEFKQRYPDYDLSEEAVTKYFSDVEPSGIDVEVYYDYSKKRSKCKGVDLNGDGKTDSGSVKREVLEVINSLPISYSQKDVLYYLNGWSASTIYEAPWH